MTSMGYAVAVAGAERDRLWARFADFLGWGAHIAALATRRSTETAVVVLEPATERVADMSAAV